MHSVEKITALPGPPTIGFVLISPAQEPLQVELQSFDPIHAAVRLTDSQGTILMEDSCEEEEPGRRMTFAVRHLEPGTYFCEVDDGFYHQVKEIHIS
ncbi:MAG: hypothetical protein AAFV07_03435 [Bacteroidota bacterium]